MTKITHLFKTYFPNTQGGLEEAIRQMGKTAIKNNFEVEVISVSKNPIEKVLDGIKCKSYHHDFGSNASPFSYGLAKDFNKIIKNTDILHLQFPWPTGELLTLIHNVKIPIVLTFHCDIHNRELIRKLYTPFLNRLFNKVDLIVPTSENLLNSTEILHRFRSKCVSINLWLDEERFSNLSNPDEQFEKQVGGFNEFCLFVGVLRWYKGLDCLFNAAKTIKKNIVIVGKGPLYDELNKRIIDEGLKNVFLLGYQSDSNVKYLLKKCSFVILPSISAAEAFGQILLEASYFKKPMITTELGTGTSFVNLHNETGFVCEPGNTKQLSDYSNELFSSQSLISEFGNNAFSRFKNNFTEEIQGPKYIDIYNKLL